MFLILPWGSLWVNGEKQTHKLPEFTSCLAMPADNCQGTKYKLGGFKEVHLAIQVCYRTKSQVQQHLGCCLLWQKVVFSGNLHLSERTSSCPCCSFSLIWRTGCRHKIVVAASSLYPTAAHINLLSQWPQDAFYLGERRGSGRVSATCISFGEHPESSGSATITRKFKTKENTKIFGGWWGGHVLVVRNRDGLAILEALASVGWLHGS